MEVHSAVREEWRQIIREWRESGLIGAEFCRQRDVRSRRFYKWRQRLADEEGTEGVRGFSALSFSDSGSSHGCGVCVVISDNVHLALSPGFDEGVLRRAVQVLGGSC